MQHPADPTRRILNLSEREEIQDIRERLEALDKKVANRYNGQTVQIPSGIYKGRWGVISCATVENVMHWDVYGLIRPYNLRKPWKFKEWDHETRIFIPIGGIRRFSTLAEALRHGE